MRQRLEQVLYETPRVQERERVYRVIDLDYLSASVLYTEPIEFKENKTIIRPSGFIISLGNLGLNEEGIKEVHETYKIDEEGNLSYGHLTFTTEDNKKKRIFYDNEEKE